ncbi:MAG: hypothetical protein JJE09_13925 [Bacteroidia bacterium]|nr:hypothetical protein [Bacteroidia bacterium]
METQDPEKRKLIETSDRHKRELEKEVKAISDKTEQVLKNAVIIGGALALTYFTISQLTKTRRKKAKDKNGESEEEEEDSESSVSAFISQLGDRVISQGSLILLDFAKDMLMEYLESRKTKDENS